MQNHTGERGGEPELFQGHSTLAGDVRCFGWLIGFALRPRRDSWLAVILASHASSQSPFGIRIPRSLILCTCA